MYFLDFTDDYVAIHVHGDDYFLMSSADIAFKSFPDSTDKHIYDIAGLLLAQN